MTLLALNDLLFNDKGYLISVRWLLIAYSIKAQLLKIHDTRTQHGVSVRLFGLRFPQSRRETENSAPWNDDGNGRVVEVICKFVHHLSDSPCFRAKRKFPRREWKGYPSRCSELFEKWGETSQIKILRTDPSTTMFANFRVGQGPETLSVRNLMTSFLQY